MLFSFSELHKRAQPKQQFLGKDRALLEVILYTKLHCTEFLCAYII